MILKVAALGYLTHLTFGSICPLGLREAGCTLEFQVHTYWSALEILVRDRPGAVNLAQLQFVMWLVSLPA